jgi:hypothetical protein
MDRPSEPEFALTNYFKRNGCARHPDSGRRNNEKAAYKKGYELRFTAFDEAECAEILRLLAAAGIKAGKPFAKRSQFIIPVYGRDAYERMVALLETSAQRIFDQ